MATPLPGDIMAQTTAATQQPFCLKQDKRGSAPPTHEEEFLCLIECNNRRMQRIPECQTQFAFHLNVLDYIYTVCAVCGIWWPPSQKKDGFQ